MPKPKPLDDFEQISVRVPATLATALLRLAEKSNDGRGMSRNRYCTMALSEAVKVGILFRELEGYDVQQRGGAFADDDTQD